MSRWSELKNPPELEADVLKFWEESKIFQKSLDASINKPSFVFYEGPPTANGMPHNGHVLTRVIKDLFPRYRTMRGYRVDRKAGWDTHGLPVEVEVEKELGIHGREEIEEYGIEPFTARCIESVFRYTTEWEELTRRIGFWVDLPNAYVTYHRSYVESVWWALSELFKKGLLYQGHKIVWWWPQGGTALSSGEVGEGYKTVEDPSAMVRFPLKAAGCALLGVESASLLAWTTTPWTLPSNTALSVNGKETYVLVNLKNETGSERIILARALAEAVLGANPAEGEAKWVIEQEFEGSKLEGLEYEPLYQFEAHPPQGERPWIVVTGDHVTLDTGSGIVHTAPAFGEDDFNIMKAKNLAFLQLVGANGRFKAGTGFLSGLMFKEADKPVAHDLKERGLLFSLTYYRHDYPFCPRADSDPLMQYARPSWFIRTTDKKAEALANNAQVKWYPETIRDGRFGDFLRNNVDWALSRERYWGTPLPIWICKACDHRTAVSSVQDILSRNPHAFDGMTHDDGTPVNEHLQVHRPWIDRVTLPCEKCGGTQHRVPEVIDCWFDSGCMPFAQFGFPHQNQDDFRKAFPADFISEAIDQTRGWFYSLLMVSTLVFDAETRQKYNLVEKEYPRPYQSCIVLGHVCDKDGKKESKSKGNYTSPDLVLKGRMKVKIQGDPSVLRGQLGMRQPQVNSLALDNNERMRIETDKGTLSLQLVARPVKGKDLVWLNPEDMQEFGLGTEAEILPPFAAPGADAFRWLFYAANPPWLSTRISLKAILEGQREFLLRLKNVHQFFVLNAGEYQPRPVDPATHTHVLDRWILHELNALTQNLTHRLDNYQSFESARALNAFVDGLSNWYLRRSRDRFDSAQPQDFAAACDTLYTVLTTLSRLIAPFVPFMADGIYQGLKRADEPESVHLCDWPATDSRWLNAGLAADMELARELASLGLAARAQVGVRVRQPLAAAEVILADASRADQLAEVVGLVREELNVRGVHFSQDPTRFVSFKVKPDFKVLGKKLGKDMKACQSALAGMDGSEVRAKVLGGGLQLDLPGGSYVLGPEEIVVAVEPKAGFQAAGSAVAVVALSCELNEDLREEGMARELISKIQQLRKQLGLAYADSVTIEVRGSDRVGRAYARFQALIHEATGVVAGSPGSDAVEGEVSMDEDQATVRVARA